MISKTEKKVVAIIQARMGSSRLPGKVLLPIAEREMLDWVVKRTLSATLINQVVVATTTDASDNPIVEFCKSHEYQFTRGSLHDVLDRYYQTATAHQANVIVRLTADCPFIDPDMLNSNIRTFLETSPPLDFAANRLPMERTVPIGLDTEICTMEALTKAWEETASAHHREHVMPYFYENPNIFNILHIKHSPDYGSLRWTVDTKEDLVLANTIATHFSGRDDFSWKEILTANNQHPEWEKINNEIIHKDYREVDKRR
jgi:spore coat polysaccharide biosynthesis protein SpsF